MAPFRASSMRTAYERRHDIPTRRAARFFQLMMAMPLKNYTRSCRRAELYDLFKNLTRLALTKARRRNTANVSGPYLRRRHEAPADDRELLFIAGIVQICSTMTSAARKCASFRTPRSRGISFCAYNTGWAGGRSSKHA